MNRRECHDGMSLPKESLHSRNADSYISKRVAVFHKQPNRWIHDSGVSIFQFAKSVCSSHNVT
jgi:hypothetical protein